MNPWISFQRRHPKSGEQVELLHNGKILLCTFECAEGDNQVKLVAVANGKELTVKDTLAAWREPK